jgi:TolB protein
MRHSSHTYRFARLTATAAVTAGAFALAFAPGAASAASSGVNGAIVVSKCELGGSQCPPSHLWLVDPTSGAEHALTSGADAEDTPSFSPDGSRIVFRRCPAGGATCRIAMIDANGANQHDLTGGSAADDYPTYSPDGSRIAFTRGLGEEIYTMAADGTDVKPLGPGAIASGGAFFSPDGSSLVFSRHDTGIGYRIFKVASGGGTPVALTLGPKDYDPSFSPDGSQILFSRSNGNQAIWTMGPDGAGQHALTPFVAGADDAEPTFSPDGTQIVFERTTSGPTVTSPLMVMNAEGGNPHAITPLSEYFYKADWQPLHPVPAAPVADTTAPILKLSVPRKESVGKGRLYLFVTSNEAATAVASGGVAVPVASKRFALKRSTRSLSANSRTKVQVTLRNKPLRAIRVALGRHRKVKARIVLTVVDGAGNTTRKALTIRLKK